MLQRHLQAHPQPKLHHLLRSHKGQLQQHRPAHHTLPATQPLHTIAQGQSKRTPLHENSQPQPQPLQVCRQLCTGSRAGLLATPQQAARVMQLQAQAARVALKQASDR